MYGIVAIFCEVVVGIGLSLVLLLELFFNRKTNKFHHNQAITRSVSGML